MFIRLFNVGLVVIKLRNAEISASLNAYKLLDIAHSFPN